MRKKSENSRKATRQAGFTLLELIVVVSIIGTVAGISLYAYSQSRPKIQLTNTGREVVSFLNRARLTAIRMHRNVTVTIQTSENSEATDYNPMGIDKEYLVLTVTDAFGNDEEISSFLLPKSYPPVFLWGHGETVVHGASSTTFPSDELTFNSDGTVSGVGAFRFSTPRTGSRNILEVAVLTKSGNAIVRKYLEEADRPESAEAQEYFAETTGSATTKNLWVWY